MHGRKNIKNIKLPISIFIRFFLFLMKIVLFLWSDILLSVHSLLMQLLFVMRCEIMFSRFRQLFVQYLRLEGMNEREVVTFLIKVDHIAN